MTGHGGEIYDRPQRTDSTGNTVGSRPMRAPKGPEKGPEKEPEKGPGRFHASRERRCLSPTPNTSAPATEHGLTAPAPMHTIAGFLPALIAARRRRPETPMAAWRAVAHLTAAPGEHHVSATDLCALVDDIATPEHHG